MRKTFATAQSDLDYTFHDVEEFLTLNSDVVSTKEYHQLIHQPGSILKVLKQYNNETNAASGTEEEQALHKHFTQPCVSVPRSLYSAVEEDASFSDENHTKSVLQPASGIPIGLNVSMIQFDTSRFRYRTTAPRTTADGVGKTIIDVTQIPKDKFHSKTAHRPLAMCPSPWVDYVLPIGIPHYLGSWESYASRDDARSATGLKSYKAWKGRSYGKAGGADDEARPWLQGFVNEVGLGAANALLSTAGYIPLELRQRPMTLNETESIITATSR